MLQKPKRRLEKPKSPEKIVQPHQLEFRFMGIKEVKGLSTEWFSKVYSLGSDFVGEERHLQQVVFRQIDPKTMEPISHLELAQAGFDERHRDNKINWTSIAKIPGLDEFVGNRRVGVAGWDVTGVSPLNQIMLENLGVKTKPKDWARKGIASAAVNSLMQIAKKQGIKVMVAFIGETNIASVKTAEKVGFKRFKKSTAWVKEL